MGRSLKEDLEQVERDRPPETTQEFNPEVQPELFEDDILSRGIYKAMEQATSALEEKFKKLGFQIGDKYSDMIMDECRVEIMRNLPDDIRTAIGNQEDPESFIEEDDAYYQITSDVCKAFIEGMSQNWPHVIDNGQ